jgi:hypothetical protein
MGEVCAAKEISPLKEIQYQFRRSGWLLKPAFPLSPLAAGRLIVVRASLFHL